MPPHDFHYKCSLMRVCGAYNSINSFNNTMQGRVCAYCHVSTTEVIINGAHLEKRTYLHLKVQKVYGVYAHAPSFFGGSTMMVSLLGPQVTMWMYVIEIHITLEQLFLSNQQFKYKMNDFK